MANSDKPLKDLLKLLLKSLDESYRPVGLCAELMEMFWESKIETSEYSALDLYIKNNIPKKSFYWKMSVTGPAKIKKSNGSFYWKPYQKAPRIKWLKKQIESL